MAAQGKGIEKLTERLVEQLSARKWSVAGMRHTEKAVAVKEKLTELVRKLLVCGTELKGEVLDGYETVADLGFQ